MSVDTLPGGAVRVVNTPPGGEILPTWRLEEELRIGRVDAPGPASFGQVKGIAVTDDGRIAVLDAQAQELRIFGSDGRHLTTYGGKGGGPGEMQSANGLMRGPEGGLWVPDQRNARMSVFDPDRGFVRSWPFRFRLWGFIWTGAMTEDGRILKRSTTLSRDEREDLRVYDVVDGELRQVDSHFLPRPDRDSEESPASFYWEVSGGARRGYLGVPFYARRVQALDPRGVMWSTRGSDPSYRVFRWAPGGDTTLVLETRRPPVPVTGAERDSAIDRVRESLREYGASTSRDWSRIPARKPAVSSLFVAGDGRLWVRTPSADGTVTYDVYRRDGRYAGTAVTSLSVWPHVAPVVRDDRLWAVARDELGVPYVVRARLVPAQGGG